MATLPLWIGPVGLYQYLGIEIAIWMIYGLGYNLLLGYSGLPSFGHGALFGIGAYAFGLFQLRVWPIGESAQADYETLREAVLQGQPLQSLSAVRCPHLYGGASPD